MQLQGQTQLKPHFIACAAVVLLAFTGLNYHLANPDEGRYAEIPREMIERGDWITPTLNYAPYFEKPPLAYWLTAASLTVFGEHEWAVRLIPALFALLGLLVAYRLSRQTVGAGAARWAPVLLFTSPLYFVMARLPLTDTVFAVCLAATMAAWWEWERSEGRSRWLGLVTGVLLGLAILSKGPVAVVLFVGSVGIYMLAARRLTWRRVGGGVYAVLIGCAVAAPWFLAVQAHNPGFANYFFIVQNFDRFSGQNFNEHAKPVWYFLPMAVLGMGLWAALWPWVIARVPAAWRRSLPEQRQGWLYLAAWAVFPLFFFSLSSCKLVTYILPIQWSLAALSAYGIDKVLSRPEVAPGVRRIMVGVAVFMVALLAWGVPELASRDPHLSSSPVTLTSFAIVIGSWLAAATGLIVAPRLRLPQWRWGMLAVAAALVWAGLIPVFGDLSGGMHLAGLLPKTLHADGPGRACTLAQYREYDQSLTFYTHMRVVLIDKVDEIKLGLQEPDAAVWFRKGEASIDDLSDRGPLALVVKARNAEELAAAHHLMLYRKNSDRALLLNSAAMKLLAVSPEEVYHAQ
ncbi:MAG: phospholipid carrier-dependent glycosyltransferase [Armatimonadia bacterium]